MKNLFVLLVLMATVSLLNAGNLPQGSESFQLGYFTGYPIGGGSSYNININVNASAEGTFTYTGNFGNYNPTAHIFSSTQSGVNWTVTFVKVDFIYYGYLFYTSYSDVEYYTELFRANNTYCITYTVTSNSLE
jgi:hypothetical protein